MLYVGSFRLFELAQGGFPTAFQFGGDQAIIGIHAAALALCQGRLVSQPLQGLCVCVVNVLTDLLLSCQRSSIHVQFDGGDGLEKGFDHAGIDGIRGDVLTDRNAILLSEVVAQIARRVLILDQSCVATFSTVDEPM